MTELWIDDNGRIACDRHSGAYLATAVASSPRKASHRTPLGEFTRATAADDAEWAEMGMGAMVCESRACAA